MDDSALKKLLEEVAAGRLSPEQASRRISSHSYADLGYAKLDLGRSARCGVPEVVYCGGKTPDEAAGAAAELWARSGAFLATRAEPQHAQAIRRAVPEAEHHERARCLWARRESLPGAGLVLVVSAGTADAPVAEEARITAEFLGSRTAVAYDCGVAGIHRLYAHEEQLHSARVIVVVAGMEGALPSVVAGLVSCPVLAVPTSVGYGASFGGLTALLAMLNTCAPGVAVLNIDNGFGAGCMAHRIGVMT